MLGWMSVAQAAPVAYPAPVRSLAVVEGQPVVAAEAEVAVARSGGTTWAVTRAPGQISMSLQGQPLDSLIEVYGVAADPSGAVAWGLDNSGPSGTTWGWARAAGPVAWQQVIHGRGYAAFVAGQVSGDLVALAGTSDDELGHRYATWVIGLDRATGAVRWEHTFVVGGWGVPVALVADPASHGFVLVGHTAPEQPLMEVAAVPYTVAIGRDGTVGKPMVLRSAIALSLEDAAIESTGRVWLVGTALAKGATRAEGPWLGAVGRVEGGQVTWKAVPGCRAATEVEVDGDRLWLGGHEGRWTSGFVESWPLSAFDAWDPVTSCRGA